MQGSELETALPFTSELVDLAAAHRMEWLSAVLPPGPCLLWAGGPSLAAAIASNGSRATLLLEPTERRTQVALAHGAPGVIVRHTRVDVLDAAEPTIALDDFASIVVLPREEDEIDLLLRALLRHAHPRCATVVVDRAGRSERSMEALVALGRQPTVIRQTLRSASCIDVHEHPVTILPDPTTCPDTDEAVLVLAGLQSAPSVLLGGDAGPARWLTDAATVTATLQRIDQELMSQELQRIQELEEALDSTVRALASAEETAASLQLVADDRNSQIDALLSSTSWRISAPARWLSEVVAALRRGR